MWWDKGVCEPVCLFQDHILRVLWMGQDDLKSWSGYGKSGAKYGRKEMLLLKLRLNMSFQHVPIFKYNVSPTERNPAFTEVMFQISQRFPEVQISALIH